MFVFQNTESPSPCILFFCHEFVISFIGFIETPLLKQQFGLGGFPMDIKYQDVFKEYDFKITGTYRIRGAHIIETNNGPRLFKRLECSANQVEFEDEIQQLLLKKGHPYVDLYVRNSKDEIITADSRGNQYVIKNWNSGTESDLRKEEDVISSVTNLARLHVLLRGTCVNEKNGVSFKEKNLNTSFEKRLRELRRVRSYIRKKRKKHEFELCFLDCYDSLFAQANMANDLLKESQYNKLLEEAISNSNICHGNYTYHNIIFLDKKQRQIYKKKQVNKQLCNNSYFQDRQIATNNFDKAVVGIQINDLYHFIRKTMEKNHWDISLGNKIIEAYDSTCAISKEEAELLYILLLYPEKFWKVCNHYYNGKKAWVPKRTTEKLADVNKQIISKDRFLKQLKEKLDFA